MGIRELAKHLNVSIGTVSRALNGHKEVNAETRRRVLEAARALGYAPNQSGRSLRQGTSNTVAFVLSAEGTGEQDASFFMALCRGIQAALASHGLDLVIHLTTPGADPLSRVQRIVERRLADGLILPEIRRTDARLDYLADKAFPFVALGRSLSGGAHPWLDLDFESAVRQGVARLAALGHRRIALATGNAGLMLDHILRDAYRRAVLAHGLVADPTLSQEAPIDETGGDELARRFLALPKPPTAILFAHQRAVAGAYRRFAAAGCRPGRDIAILSCSPDSPTAQFLVPALTCFRLALPELGRRLADALLAIMPGHRPAEADLVQTVWPWELVARESDACPPPSGAR